MNRLKGLRVLFLALIVVAGVMATMSSAAMAEPFFKPSNEGMRWSGELTLLKNFGSEVKCKFPESYHSETSLYSFSLWQLVEPSDYLTCSNGTRLAWAPAGLPYYSEGKYSLHFGDRLNNWGAHESPYGLYEGLNAEVPWTNGTGSAPSTITFSKTIIGVTETGAALIRAAGTLTVTTEKGGNIYIAGS